MEPAEAKVTKLPAPYRSGAKPMPLCPQDVDSAFRMAKAIFQSGLAPKGFGNEQQVFVAMQLGAEVGLSPMAAIQNIAVINGKPGIFGTAQLGIVQASGLLEWIKETSTGQGDSLSVTVEVKRMGDPEVKSSTFSAAQAKKAGLWGKAGPWQQYPERMVMHRARTYALRDKFADVLSGLAYTVEELQDLPTDPKDVTPRKPLAESLTEALEASAPGPAKEAAPHVEEKPEETQERKVVEDGPTPEDILAAYLKGLPRPPAFSMTKNIQNWHKRIRRVWEKEAQADFQTLDCFLQKTRGCILEDIPEDKADEVAESIQAEIAMVMVKGGA